MWYNIYEDYKTGPFQTREMADEADLEVAVDCRKDCVQTMDYADAIEDALTILNILGEDICRKGIALHDEGNKESANTMHTLAKALALPVALLRDIRDVIKEMKTEQA